MNSDPGAWLRHVPLIRACTFRSLQGFAIGVVNVRQQTPWQQCYAISEHTTADTLCIAVKALCPNQFLSFALSLNQTMCSCTEKTNVQGSLLSGPELQTLRPYLSRPAWSQQVCSNCLRTIKCAGRETCSQIEFNNSTRAS